MQTRWAVAADLLDPPPPDVWTPLGYTPNPGPQTELHALVPFADGGPFDVLFGGAVFGGKSHGLLMDTLQKAARYPGLEAWLIRETYPQLYDSFIQKLERLGYCKAIGGRWNGAERTLRLGNGSMLKFRHARNMADAADMLSASCQLLVIDERTRIDPQVVEQLSLRVRVGDVPSVPVIGIRSASNPGGPGHSTVKSEFIDPAPQGRVLLTARDELGNPIPLGAGRQLERYYLPSRIGDNPAGVAADPTYEARLALLGPELRAAYRDGDWSRFEGMRFAQFQLGLHVVEPDWELVPPEATRGRGVDYGMSAPFACVWGAVVNERVIIYRELHEAGLTPRQQAEGILDRELAWERHPMPTTWIDPSTFARDPEKPKAAKVGTSAPAGSIAERYATAGVEVRRANNDRKAGWSLLDELLVPQPDGLPRLVIFSTCVNVIRSLTGAPRDPRNPEDVDGAYTDDHALDALRYCVMGLAKRTGEAVTATSQLARATLPTMVFSSTGHRT